MVIITVMVNMVSTMVMVNDMAMVTDMEKLAIIKRNRVLQSTFRICEMKNVKVPNYMLHT